MIPKLKEESYANFGGMNQKASRYMTGTQEALDISNFDFSVLNAHTKRPGTTQYIGSTVQGPIFGLYEFNQLSGFSQIISTANTNAYAVVGQALNGIRSNLLNNGIFNFITFVDRMFATNGQDFFRYDGTNTYSFSLPPGLSTFGATITGGATGSTGVYTYYYGYLNERGYYGPAINGITAIFATNQVVELVGFTTPQGFGITAGVVYRTDANLTTAYQIGYFTPGATSFFDGNLPLNTALLANQYLWFTMAPQALEIFNNQNFLIGFSANPSTTYFSDIGEPEGIGATAFFEVRTNDGDYLTTGKSYFSQLCLAKQRSFHALSGDNPANFALRQITDQYGCIAKRAIAVYEQTCWFLDEKGVCEFDGANVEIVSNRVEPFFKQMNLPVARKLAQMLHVKSRNEVWTAIPYQGASVNNLILVYDYASDAWAHFDGLNPSAIALMTGSLSTRSVGFGDFSGAINYMGASLFGDNGRAITALISYPFKNGHENSTEHFWRRLWIDLDAFGLTQTISVNLYANQSSLAAFTNQLISNGFQNRIEFGVSSKDLAVQLIHSQMSPLRINGYTIAHRFQREV